MTDNDRFDSAFAGIASQAGGIEPLLGAFFGFLKRRTDFYIESNLPDAKMGFKPGHAEQKVLSAFRQYPMEKLPSLGSEENSHGSVNTQTHVKQTKESTYNGGKGNGYIWNQTRTDLTIHVQCPPGTSAKQVQCLIARSTFRLSVDGNEILNGTYPENMLVSPDDCFWSCESDTGLVTVTLDKKQHTWWPCVVEGEPTIDLQQIDSTRKVSEYDEATQATINKIRFDQHQQRIGAPTSEQLLEQEILEKSKGLPGSPFVDR